MLMSCLEHLHVQEAIIALAMFWEEGTSDSGRPQRERGGGGGHGRQDVPPTAWEWVAAPRISSGAKRSRRHVSEARKRDADGVVSSSL